MRTVAFHNLGCKVNAYEIDIIQQKFTENGFQVVDFSQKADVYVINTCTVTSIADRKSRQMLHRAKEKNPDAVVIAVGCYVQTDSERVVKDTAVDIAVGNNLKSKVYEIYEEYEKNRKKNEGGEHRAFSNIIDINKPCEYERMQLTDTADRTRAYIKIQDGCNQFCSYCLIPYARGRVRSRDMQDILDEIKHVGERGYKEVVLTGIHVSSYGIEDPNDLSQNKLAELIENIGKIDSIERIRLSSLEPRVVTDEFVERISKVRGLCPHFHLSLQSGCNDTLKRMNRHYTAEEYLEGVNRLRRAFDDPAITTDVIVGFPGETEKEFRESLDFVKRVDFYEMHVFKYSSRKGTVAAGLPNKVSDADKAARSDMMLEVTKERSAAFRRAHIGSEASVLLEEEQIIDGKHYMTGFTPEYIKAAVPADASKDLSSGRIVKVRLTGALNDEVISAAVGDGE